MMPIEEYLLPGEYIMHQSALPLEYRGELYEFYITNKRLMWFRLEGLIFKRERFASEDLADVRGVRYCEKGIFGKKGVMEIHVKDRKLEFSGLIRDVKSTYEVLSKKFR